jgi:hypothetical protein
MVNCQQLMVSSPTLSELGFVAASASADVAAAKRLQQQKQEGGLGRTARDMDGLSFEQRLELLCAESGSGSPSSSREGNASLQVLQDADAAPAADAAEHQEEGAALASSSYVGSARGGDIDSVASAAQAAANQPGAMLSMVTAGVQGSSSACCATQTSPLPYGIGYTQVGSESWLTRHVLLLVLQYRQLVICCSMCLLG